MLKVHKQTTFDPADQLSLWSFKHFFEVMNKVRWEDYDLKFAEKNRFTYLANGFAQREFDGRDLSWYIGLLEGGKDAQPEYTDEAIKEFLNVGTTAA